ncbi:MAG: MFS transporter [Vibrio fluvialis]
MSTIQPNPSPETRTAIVVLWALSLCHMLNDTIQSLLPAIYPVLQANYALTFTQIGIMHFAYQCTAALLQPVIGNVTDTRPSFRLLPAGMGMSLLGLLILAYAHSYGVLVIAAMAVGLGSAIFHPDAARFARAASGGRFGFAQSVFQVGGNAGTATGPLLAAYIVLPFGQGSIAWFSAIACLGMIVLWKVGTWARSRYRTQAVAGRVAGVAATLRPGRVALVIGLLAMLVVSKQLYVAGLSTFYTFYLIETFGVSVRTAQLLLFMFLAATAAGVLIGGPIGDRIGRKAVIWVSILGILPFTIALPHVGLVMATVLTCLIGIIRASAFPAIIV